MNNIHESIARTENRIKAGNYEPTLPVRVYRQTTSEEHVKLGASFFLYMSFNTMADAVESVEEELREEKNNFHGKALHTYEIIQG